MPKTSSRGPKTPDVQTSLFSDHPVRTSASPAAASGWMETAATWRSSPLALLTSCAPAGWFSRTSPAYCRLEAEAQRQSVRFEKVQSEDEPTVTKTVISPPSSPSFSNAGILDATGLLTLNMPEYRSGGAASSLSSILETGDLPRRFFLSPKACAGIIRRAGKRGKDLPPQLARALQQAADSEPISTLTADSTSPPVKRSFAFDEIAPTLRSVPTAGKSHGKLNGSDRMPLVGVPDGPDGAVSAKWSKGSGGPAGDECYNLIPAAFNPQAGDDQTLLGFDPESNLTGSLTSGQTPAIAFTSKDYGGDATVDQSPTLRAMGFDESHANGGGQIAVAFQTRVARNGRGSESDLVPALNGADAGSTSDMRPCVAVFKPSHFTRGKDGKPSGVSPPLGAEPDKGDQDPLLLTDTAVRRLTPTECERLQAFPDGYTLIPYRGTWRDLIDGGTGPKLAADGPRYKALGNAMNVKEIRWVLQRIERFETEKASW